MYIKLNKHLCSLHSDSHMCKFPGLLPAVLLTDCEFVVRSELLPDVPEQRFRCHKLFLAMRSEVFNALFYGELAEQGTVAIVDVHPDGFETMLK